MYDFKKFIEIINKPNPDCDSIKAGIDFVGDDLHVGEIEVKSDIYPKHLEYFLTQDTESKPSVTYSNSGYDYLYFKRKDNYKLKDEDLNDIKVFLMLLSFCHNSFLLSKKIEEAQDISYNTKLPNSSGFMKKIHILSNTVDISKYNSYFINIKGFGLINKYYGKEQGDIAIKQYADRLKEFIDDDEVIGHLGGDNFVGFIKRERHDRFVELVTNCPIHLIRNNKKTTAYLYGVIGYYEIKENNVDYNSILSNPSMALQYSRNAKKLIVKLTDDLIEMLNSVKSIELSFKDELKKGNFVVYYQPKFDIKTGKINGVEALSRWITDGKIIPPSVFIPILEKNGEILDLDLFVLDKLCSDIHNYRRKGNLIVPASCNFSRRDLEIEDIENKIIDIIRKYDVKSEDIVIEVTETTSVEENSRLENFIDMMYSNGIRTSIDDFGTGYSALSALRDFKVDEIKIDRSFINKEILTYSDKIIIGSIIDIANKLNIDVICEGVETQEQADFLLKIGCNSAQGYLYSQPMPKLEFEAMLKKVGTVFDK